MLVEALLVQTSLLEGLRVCTGKLLSSKLADRAPLSRAKGWSMDH